MTTWRKDYEKRPCCIDSADGMEQLGLLGPAVNEEQLLGNAEYMAKHLKDAFYGTG